MSSALRNAVIFYVGLPLLIGFVLGSNQAGFGTKLPWAASVVYWVTATLMAWTVFHFGTLIAAFLLRPWEPPLLVKLAVGLLIASIPARIMLNAYAQGFYGSFVEGGQIRTLASATLTLDFALAYARTWAGPYALWLSANVFFDRVVGFNRYRLAAKYPNSDGGLGEAPRMAAKPGRAANVVPDMTSVAISPLLSALPPALGYEIVALKSEDHYLRIFTDRGDALILYRLSSAIDELEALGFAGIRVHRSYWVLRDAVVSGHVDGRQHRLRLSNGLDVPVSQTYRETARQAGLPV